MGALPVDTDHNLLFGVLALQADIITSDQFVEACTTWAARKGAPLADVLTDRGWVAPTERATIEHLMQLKLKKYGGDAHASLTAVADDSARRALARVPDPEVERTATQLAHHAGHVLVSTVTYQPETRERYTLT